MCGVPYPTEPSRNRADYLRSPLSRFLIRHRAFGRLSHEVGCRLLPRLLYLRGDYPREIMEDFHKHTHHSYTDTAERCLFRFDIRPALAAVQQLPALLIYSAIDREVPLRDAECYAVAFPHSDRLVV